MCTIGTIKIKVGLSRKEGTDNYGSIGASIEAEIELHGATPADVQTNRDHWLSWCADALDKAIADQRGAHAHAAPAAPAALPAPVGPTGKPQQSWGTAYPSAGAPTPAPPPANGSGGGPRRGNQYGPPRNGKALFARLKEMDERDPNLRIVKHVSAWAKAGGNDARFGDWSGDWVTAGWAEAEKYLEALRESARLQSGY